MSKDHEDRIDPNKPALIVLYGATKRKFRPLEGELVVLGRAPGCDIGLVSPEVAPVHCVIVRVAEGWRVRDCSGRATRVNGKAVHDEPLHNGDTIQVGTFSFEAQLPATSCVPRAHAAERGGGTVGRTPGADTTGVALPELERLQQSRRRLAELALGLRRRLREGAGERIDLAHQQAELEQVERRLRKAHDDQMTRQAALTERQTELTRRAEELDHYAAHLRRQATQWQDDNGDQVRQAEADLCRQRAAQNSMDEELRRLRAELDARQAELDATAEQLTLSLKAEREQMDRERELVNQERHELMQERIELERLREAQMRQTPVLASTRETHHDVPQGNKLESARKLLRDLAERRKSIVGGEDRGRNSRT